MKILTLSLIGYGAAVALSLSPLGPAQAQMAATPVVAGVHGDWTLREREDWLSDRMVKSRDDGSLDRVEFDRAKHQLDDLRHDENVMRDEGRGQLTDNQTTDLEARLDAMADKIHWVHESAYTRPW